MKHRQNTDKYYLPTNTEGTLCMHSLHQCTMALML